MVCICVEGKGGGSSHLTTTTTTTVVKLAKKKIEGVSYVPCVYMNNRMVIELPSSASFLLPFRLWSCYIARPHSTAIVVLVMRPTKSDIVAMLPPFNIVSLVGHEETIT